MFSIAPLVGDRHRPGEASQFGGLKLTDRFRTPVLEIDGCWVEIVDGSVNTRVRPGCGEWRRDYEREEEEERGEKGGWSPLARPIVRS